MTAHTLASHESKSLCDELYAMLQKTIPNLKRSATKGSCGLYQEGNHRFAYVYHRKTESCVEIWCRGDIHELKRHDQGLGVMLRNKQRAGWEKEFPCHFRIHKAEQISATVTLLVNVSLMA
jgi:hypothetical protein